MSDLVAFMQNVEALAFLALGVATATIWLRNRDRSSGYLALAIVLLSTVLAFGRAMSLLHITSTAVQLINLLAFVGSGYALLSYRHSLIPLSTRWRIGAAAALAATVVAYLVAMALSAPTPVLLWIAVALIIAWAGTVIEPIVRFWLVARGLPKVQAWRLRSLSLGFAGLVGILLFVLILAGARVTTTNVPTQGEASLKGHLANPTDGTTAEQQGSLAYVPPDPKDDKQLNYALDLIRGVRVDPAFPPDPGKGVPN